MSANKVLLAIVELGGYPDFTPLYEQAGFRVVTAKSIRKAIQAIKKEVPSVIVAEFNFQSDFRDRTSNLESLLAVVQRYPDCRMVVFYEKEFAHQLERLKQQYHLHVTLPFPIDKTELERALLA